MPEKNPFVLFARYSAIIAILPSCLLIGYFAGAYLDRRWSTSPYLTLVGFLLGSAAGFVQVFRILGRKP